MTLFMPFDYTCTGRPILDVLGIGFGPSNISVAIAQKELAPELNTIFLERRPSFGWHDTMLFSDATMQVNFLKDLVSLRNPRSQFSFVSFLHDHGRLVDFTNLQTLFPRRVEFHQYLAWCAAKFEELVIYGADVQKIDQVTVDGETLFRVRFGSTQGEIEWLARMIVHSGGLEPNIPFATTPSDRISHGYHILDWVKSHEPGAHYAVVGGGQSAAEIVQFLYNGGAKVSGIVSRFGYMPADDSPFVNQIFDPGHVDSHFSATDQTRSHIYNLHAATNYAGVDSNLLQDLYADWYQDRITGQNRLEFHRMCRVTSADATQDGVRLKFDDAFDATRTGIQVDYLVCATGFNARSVLGLMTDDLAGKVALDASGKPVFERDYSLCMKDATGPAIYAPHMCEGQHGLTATLLSNMAVRSGEIVESIVARLQGADTTLETRELING